MEENENLNEENKQQVKNEGELKKEATETFKETKEQIKNINFKEEAQKGKGLLGKLFGRPVETIKEIVEDNKNQFYQTTLLIIIVWIVLIFLRRIIDFIIYDYYKFDLLSTIKAMLVPIFFICNFVIIKTTSTFHKNFCLVLLYIIFIFCQEFLQTFFCF